MSGFYGRDAEAEDLWITGNWEGDPHWQRDPDLEAMIAAGRAWDNYYAEKEAAFKEFQTQPVCPTCRGEYEAQAECWDCYGSGKDYSNPEVRRLADIIGL